LRRSALYGKCALVGNAIESDRPIHLSLGSAGLGGASTLLSIASAEFAYHMIERAAIGDTSPIVTLSDASVLPLAQDSLRRAYQSRGLGAGYKSINARWYPAGSRSLAFAAAITALMGDDRVSSNVMVGSYGPELALITDASKRRKLPIIAVSDQLEGQAVAYALVEEASEPMNTIPDFVVPFLGNLPPILEQRAENLPESLKKILEEMLNRLGMTNQIGIYIPTTVAVDQLADTSTHVQKTLAFMGRIFGGATHEQVHGVWNSSEAGLVTENIHLVRSFCSQTTLDGQMGTVIDYVEALKKELQQEAMAIEVNQKLMLI
jgi:hypothetical protein